MCKIKNVKSIVMSAVPRVRFPLYTQKENRYPYGYRFSLEQVMGIEPTRPAWKAGVLPLNYTCIFLPPVSSRNYYITFNYICQQKIVLLPIYGNIFAVCPGVYRFYTSLFHNDFSNAVFHFFSDNTADITGTKLATLCLFHYK